MKASKECMCVCGGVWKSRSGKVRDGGVKAMQWTHRPRAHSELWNLCPLDTSMPEEAQSWASVIRSLSYLKAIHWSCSELLNCADERIALGI